jgi:hypothetical protein
MAKIPVNALLTVTCILLMAGVVACGEDDPTPRAWIDFPADGASVPVGSPVTVISHAYAREGVSEVLLAVNGDAYRRDAPVQTGATFVDVAQEWLPGDEGLYTLQIRAYDTAGEASNPATINVKVVGEMPRRATDTPAPAGETPAPPTETPTGTPTQPVDTAPPTDPPTSLPTVETPTLTPPTRTPTQTPTTNTPWPAVQVSFGADRTSLVAGECTTLRWDVVHSTAVYLDGEGVAAQGLREICPGGTATYVLYVEAPSGNTERGVTIDVSVPSAQVSFSADAQSLVRGECTTLRWDVEHATAVYLDGDGVVGHGQSEVCPESTTTYNLHVEAPSGTVDRSVTVNVSEPPDTNPPPAPTPAVPADGLTLSCRAEQTLAWQPVSDASGISGYYVKLERQITAGEWQSVRGWGPVNGKQVEAEVQCGVFYRWAVRAQDTAGNYSEWSEWSDFSVSLD